MITKIILYIISIIIMIRILSKKCKKYLILLCGVILLSIIIILASSTENDLNSLVGDAELIGTYENLGTIYYDENDNMYFVINVNPWNLFESFKKTDIDYNLGEIAHIASHITNEMENLIESYYK